MAAISSPTSVTDICLAAKAAARGLGATSSAVKDAALLAMASALEARTPEILEANARDLEAGRESGLSAALMDRLTLDAARVRGIADGTRAIRASTSFECAAEEDPRSRTALPDFKHSAAASIVTFGRAS